MKLVNKQFCVPQAISFSRQIPDVTSLETLNQLDRGGMAEWSRRSAHDRKVVGSNLVGTTFHLQSTKLSILSRSVSEYQDFWV